MTPLERDEHTIARLQRVGCADVVRAFPEPTRATLGLLLVAEPHQGRGIGTGAYRLLEERIVYWGSCVEIVLGVVRTNEQALAFWSKVGFAPTGTVKPYSNGPVCSELILLAKRLQSSNRAWRPSGVSE